MTFSAYEQNDKDCLHGSTRWVHGSTSLGATDLGYGEAPTCLTGAGFTGPQAGSTSLEATDVRAPTTPNPHLLLIKPPC